MAVYLYCIKEDYKYQSSIKGNTFDNEWFKIEAGGTITVKGSNKNGYAWDGCSPKFRMFKDLSLGTPDAVLNDDTGKSKTYYASLVHDLFYQFSKDLKPFVKREEADNEFLTILKRDKFALAKIYHWGVRTFGWLFW